MPRIAALWVALALLASPALAAETAAVPGTTPAAAAPATLPADWTADVPALGTSEAAARVRWIQQRLQAADRRLDIWTWGWTLGFAGLTLGQTVLAELEDEPGPHAQAVVGALGSTLGLASMAITPVRRVLDHAEAASRLDPEDPAALAEAERLLREAAERQREGFAWTNHVLGIAVSLGGAAAIWKAWPADHPREALIHLASSLVVSELQLFTQPRRAVRDLEAYERGDWMTAAAPRRPRASLIAAASPAGVTLGLRF